ncbi:rhamnulokinase family protein [Psychromonas sp. MME1]|uniref:rhamnulokinase n=1 Tax=Psychromonas sp. MME1 TaxID=3231032 RepID=UPI0034E2B34C
MMKSVIAIDLGAGSGRVIHGLYKDNKLILKEFHRFENINVIRNDFLCWDTDYLITEIKEGIDRIIAAGITPDCMAIDSWGVDFVLIDKDGLKLGDSVTYRDPRTTGLMDKTIAQLGKDYLYKITGIQFLPFNTIYQLIALKKQNPCWLNSVKHLLFIPDYLGFRLTGTLNCEYTNATTSQMVNCQTMQWDEELLHKLSLPSQWLLPISKPNRIIGTYSHEMTNQVIPFASITSHDTAAAVLAVPKVEKNVAYLSSGTWSLMGIESDQAIVSKNAQDFNITNEGGVEGKFRVLKNIMGLWLIQGIQKELKQYSLLN